MTTQSLRPRRNVFLLFLGAAFVSLMVALPLVVAQTESSRDSASAAQGATQPQGARPRNAESRPAAPEHPGFDGADRNKDGFLDKSEAGVVPGLSANFERADRNRDGKLDRAEFEGGLQLLQVRR